jgi:hypothetical protein
MTAATAPQGAVVLSALPARTTLHRQQKSRDQVAAFSWATETVSRSE